MAHVMPRQLGPETLHSHQRREAEGFYSRFLSGDSILDIGYRGGDPNSVPVTENAIGVELDYPGYDGLHLPFETNSQDSVFASHCLEHIEDYKTVLADWYRVLKIGGYLIIAVPHRDLYERKATLPSRFNADHKRFYTPASLLTEIEESLPVGGYRIRSLKDVDTGFNYAILPDQHAQGSYEIELVIQRIAPPVYVDQLRPSLLSTEWRAFYASLLCKAVQALKDGRAADVQEIVSFLAKQPLPTFAELKRQIKMMPAHANDIKTEAIADLKSILTPVIMAQPFDAGPYVKKYEDVAQMVEKRGIEYARLHYAHHGYFEGRSPDGISPSA
jgi:SAM-dependent methyltransferase